MTHIRQIIVVKSFITIIFTFLSFSASVSGQTLPLIPAPAEQEILPGSFSITPATTIRLQGAGAEKTAALLNSFLESNYGFKLKYGSGKNSIRLEIDAKVSPESYALIINRDGILLKGDAAGLFYGLQTLQQLFPVGAGNDIHIPCTKIHDQPRFAHRGMMLDVGRYFFPMDYLKEFIDRMAHYKLNVFHWHLTEDGGWRIEIKKYPDLTRKAAWRNSTQYNYAGLQDRIPHGGFYTQEQVKELVRYAAERHVTIIPEIEMPGHSLAVLSAYPGLSCTGGPFAVPIYWRLQQEIFCAGNDSVFTFLEDVLSEIIPLFPSKYIHIGGDEAPKKRWEACTKCQDRIRAEGLKDEHELQSYFIHRIEKFVNSKGKQIIGWDEILEGGLAPNATVMSWRGEAGGIEAANMGHGVIMAPDVYLYFDYAQSLDKDNEPAGIGRHLPLEKVYGYEPYTPKLTPEQCTYIKGVQANLWTAFIQSRNVAEYMLFPRTLALSEIAWSPASKKDYKDFLERLPARLAALDAAGVTFRIPEPDGWDKVSIENGYATIQLRPLVEGAKIYYTTDGSDPATTGKLYDGTLRLPLTFKGLDVRCVVTLPSGRNSNVYKLTPVE